MKRQVLVIHGGDTFETYERYISFLESYKIDLDRLRKRDWKTALPAALGDSFDVVAPMMPNKWNAKYPEWKLWFEKIVALLDDEVILVGHSLGGSFLARYLAENRFPKKISGLLLVSAPFRGTPDEPLLDFTPPDDLGEVGEQAEKIFLYHSADDPVVPIGDLDGYVAAWPQATVRRLDGRGHINQENFPELESDILHLLGG